ncbi:MAG TPA: peptidylprolyl isomerase [Chitinophagaceae bacterium]|nr:peptidylprolyl isomerase [Chitinophagaceae bacterium]
MKIIVVIVSLVLAGITVSAQNNNARLKQIISELEKSKDPIPIVKKWKKKYKLDTVSVISPGKYLSLADSIAYTGKIGKVYGPFPGDSILVMIAAKAPNVFYHAAHILFDTITFRKKVSSKMADNFIQQIKNGQAKFEDLARTYNIDGSGETGGDFGLLPRGVLIPELDKEIIKHKKGDIVKVISRNGVHIVKIIENPKKDTGFAIMLRIFL